MLAHEYRSEVSSKVASQRRGEETVATPHGTSDDNQSLELDVLSVAPPLIRLQTKFNPGNKNHDLSFRTNSSPLVSLG